jgi:hypothetical protein
MRILLTITVGIFKEIHHLQSEVTGKGWADDGILLVQWMIGDILPDEMSASWYHSFSSCLNERYHLIDLFFVFLSVVLNLQKLSDDINNTNVAD